MPWGTRRTAAGEGIGGQAEPSLTGLRAAAQAGASEGYEDAARRVAESPAGRIVLELASKLQMRYFRRK